LSHKYVDLEAFVISTLPISLPPLSTKERSFRFYFNLEKVARLEINRKSVFRLVAIALLVLCAGFAFPESHYSEDRTFVKAPSHQTEISCLLCDDAEDSNDLSIDAHLFVSLSFVDFNFYSKETFLSKSFGHSIQISQSQVFLRHRCLLI
jgi:hypothetical protein